MVAPASAASAHLNRQVKLEDAAKAGATCKTLLNQFLAAQLDRIIGFFASGVFFFVFFCQMELMEFRGEDDMITVKSTLTTKKLRQV